MAAFRISVMAVGRPSWLMSRPAMLVSVVMPTSSTFSTFRAASAT